MKTYSLEYIKHTDGEFPTHWVLTTNDDSNVPKVCCICGKPLQGQGYFCKQKHKFFCEYCEGTIPPHTPGRPCGSIEDRHEHFRVHIRIQKELIKNGTND